MDLQLVYRLCIIAEIFCCTLFIGLFIGFGIILDAQLHMKVLNKTGNSCVSSFNNDTNVLSNNTNNHYFTEESKELFLLPTNKSSTNSPLHERSKSSPSGILPLWNMCHLENKSRRTSESYLAYGIPLENTTITNETLAPNELSLESSSILLENDSILKIDHKRSFDFQAKLMSKNGTSISIKNLNQPRNKRDTIHQVSSNMRKPMFGKYRRRSLQIPSRMISRLDTPSNPTRRRARKSGSTKQKATRKSTFNGKRIIPSNTRIHKYKTTSSTTTTTTTENPDLDSTMFDDEVWKNTLMHLLDTSLLEFSRDVLDKYNLEKEFRVRIDGKMNETDRSILINRLRENGYLPPDNKAKADSLTTKSPITPDLTWKDVMNYLLHTGALKFSQELMDRYKFIQELQKKEYEKIDDVEFIPYPTSSTSTTTSSTTTTTMKPTVGMPRLNAYPPGAISRELEGLTVEQFNEAVKPYRKEPWFIPYREQITPLPPEVPWLEDLPFQANVPPFVNRELGGKLIKTKYGWVPYYPEEVITTTPWYMSRPTTYLPLGNHTMKIYNANDWDRIHNITTTTPWYNLTF